MATPSDTPASGSVEGVGQVVRSAAQTAREAADEEMETGADERQRTS